MAPRTAAPSNPLAGLLPSGVHLHVWRLRPGLSNVFLGRFPAEQVNPYGAIEIFLSESVAPGITPAPGQSEISFRVQVRDGANNVHADENYSVQAQRTPGPAHPGVQSPVGARHGPGGPGGTADRRRSAAGERGTPGRRDR